MSDALDLGLAATFDVARALARGGPLVALLPIGACEAHGPHLPLATDTIIAMALARAVLARAAASGAGREVSYALLPAIPYAPAEAARGFAGTISIRPETLRALIVDVAREVARHGFRGLVLVNGHLEPDHVRNLRTAVAEVRAAAPDLPVLAPEWTGERTRGLLPAEFFEGGAHAGGYETSLVLAADPVRVGETAGLAPNPQDLARHFREGRTRFEEIPGGDRAYFGDPRSATAARGRALYEALASAVDAEVRAALGGPP